MKNIRPCFWSILQALALLPTMALKGEALEFKFKFRTTFSEFMLTASRNGAAF